MSHQSLQQSTSPLRILCFLLLTFPAVDLPPLLPLLPPVHLAEPISPFVTFASFCSNASALRAISPSMHTGNVQPTKQ